MTPGASYLGTCYPTAPDAAAAQCGSAYPVSGSDAAGAFVLSCGSTTGGTLNLTRTDSSGWTSLAVTPAYSVCDQEAINGKPFDAASAGELFSVGFVIVVVGYLVAWGVAQVLGVISAP